jgi:D-alanine-D-alanine ligase-like ATP-grasp enzyme
VVKPARGEQGRGVAVGITTARTSNAVAAARQHCERVLVEECVQGEDLRLVVIDYRVVACGAAPPAARRRRRPRHDARR